MNASRLWTAIALIVSLAVLGGGYVLGVAPALASAQASAASTASARAQTQVQQKVLSDLQEQAKSVDETRAALEDLRAQMPPDSEYSAFVDAVIAAAAATGVVVTSVNSEDALLFFAAPGAEPIPDPSTEPTDSTDGQTTDETAPAPEPAPPALSSAGLVSVPVTITIKGSSDAVFAFVDKMRLSERLFLLRSLSVAPLIEADAVISAGSLVGQIYVLETSSVDSGSGSNQ